VLLAKFIDAGKLCSFARMLFALLGFTVAGKLVSKAYAHHRYLCIQKDGSKMEAKSFQRGGWRFPSGALNEEL